MGSRGDAAERSSADPGAQARHRFGGGSFRYPFAATCILSFEFGYGTHDMSSESNPNGDELVLRGNDVALAAREE